MSMGPFDHGMYLPLERTSWCTPTPVFHAWRSRQTGVLLQLAPGVARYTSPDNADRRAVRVGATALISKYCDFCRTGFSCRSDSTGELFYGTRLIFRLSVTSTNRTYVSMTSSSRIMDTGF